jgi:hypothetical protein
VVRFRGRVVRVMRVGQCATYVNVRCMSSNQKTNTTTRAEEQDQRARPISNPKTKTKMDLVTWQMSGLRVGASGKKTVSEVWPDGATQLIVGKWSQFWAGWAYGARASHESPRTFPNLTPFLPAPRLVACMPSGEECAGDRFCRRPRRWMSSRFGDREGAERRGARRRGAGGGHCRWQ